MDAFSGRLLLARALAGAAFVAVALPSEASCISDFQSGLPPDWTFSTTGVYGASGVATHNGSEMAFVSHTGGHGNNFGSSTTRSSLSCTMDYSASQTLSFDMHPVSIVGTGFGGPAQAGAGVRVDLLNAFNVAIGTVGFYNFTNPALLGTNEYAVSATQQHFETLMGDYATLLGLNPSAPRKISLTFTTWGQFVGGGNIYPNVAGSASVYFDNVAEVPEPATAALLLTGLGLFGWRRLRASS